MGRALLGAQLAAPWGGELIVATTHLESPIGFSQPGYRPDMYSGERRGQLREALSRLDRAECAVLLGDLNWNDPSARKQWDGPIDGLLPRGWEDVWRRLRRGDEGFTYDGRRNAMLTARLRKRLDRCLLKGGRGCAAVEARLVGTAPIAGVTYRKERSRKGQSYIDTLPVLPSDHFGLFVRLEERRRPGPGA